MSSIAANREVFPAEVTAMTCKSCLTAAVRKSGLFSADCRGCCARAVSRSPQFRQVQKLGKLDSEYRRLLEQFKLTHAEVKAAHAADAMREGA